MKKYLKIFLSFAFVFLLNSCSIFIPKINSGSSSILSTSSISSNSNISISSSSSYSSNSTSSSSISSNSLSEFNDYGFPVISVDIDDYNVTKDGLYTSKEEVAIYIYLYEKLPSNYKRKSQFNKSDYTSENKLSAGGDTFQNREGLLPKAPSRTFIEADIDYRGGSRNAKRIVYSSDFLIFYTSDHYASFSIMRVIN